MQKTFPMALSPFSWDRPTFDHGSETENLHPKNNTCVPATVLVPASHNFILSEVDGRDE